MLDEETKPKGDFGLASHKKHLEKIYITERKSRKTTHQTEGKIITFAKPPFRLSLI